MQTLGSDRNFQSCMIWISLGFLISNMQIIAISQGCQEVKYHVICKVEMLAIIKRTTVLVIRLFAMTADKTPHYAVFHLVLAIGPASPDLGSERK